MKCSKPNECVDCGKQISKLSMRCKSCSNIHRTGSFNWSKEAREGRIGEKNPNWKGDKVGYNSLHLWIKSRKPKPEFCERCHKRKPIDLANISGEYKRDIDDYKWLCRTCHMREDGRINNLKERSFKGENNPNYGHFRYPELANKEWLYEKYWIENLAFSEIGEMISCHLETVRRAVKRHNIPVKKDRFTKDANRLRKKEDAEKFVSIKLKNEGVVI